MKTGFWLKGGNGQLAGATVYKDKNGDTIMREVVTPSNPKTEKQTIQRIIMHTVGQSYSKLKDICDHSFEGIKAGRDSMAYFIQQNVQFARNRVAVMQNEGVDFHDMYSFVPLKMKGFTPNQYQVAMGSLPRVYCAFVYDETDDMDYPAVQEVTVNTYEEVINKLGLQRGDQLTFLVIDQQGPIEFGQNEFHYARVILDPTNADGTQAPLSSAFLDADNKINLPSRRNEGNFRFKIVASGDTAGLYFAGPRNNGITCAAVIVSRQAGDKWMRSTTYFAYKDDGIYSLGDCLDAAKAGVANPIYASNELYLNNAGEGGAVISNTTPNVSVQSVKVDNVVATVGTPFVKTIGSSDPIPALSIEVKLNGATSGSVSVLDASNEEVATSSINRNGVAEITHTPGAVNAVYHIVYNLGDDDVQTGYSYKVERQGGGLPGGGGEG